MLDLTSYSQEIKGQMEGIKLDRIIATLSLAVARKKSSITPRKIERLSESNIEREGGGAYM